MFGTPQCSDYQTRTFWVLIGFLGHCATITHRVYCIEAPREGGLCQLCVPHRHSATGRRSATAILNTNGAVSRFFHPPVGSLDVSRCPCSSRGKIFRMNCFPEGNSKDEWLFTINECATARTPLNTTLMAIHPSTIIDVAVYVMVVGIGYLVFLWTGK